MTLALIHTRALDGLHAPPVMVEVHVANGLPAFSLVGLADGDAVIEFGEGDKAKKVSQREAYLLDIESRGKVIEFGELSSHTDAGDGRPPIQAVQQTLADQVFSGGKKAAA